MGQSPLHYQTPMSHSNTRKIGLKYEVPQYGRQGKNYIMIFSQNFIPDKIPIYDVGQSPLHWQIPMSHQNTRKIRHNYMGISKMNARGKSLLQIDEEFYS